MSIKIIEVDPKLGALKKFVRFSINLYKDSPYYVPSLVLDEVNTLMPDKNPAFDFCESIYFMAYRDEKPVGRIAGIINKQVNERTGENELRFGFVDFIDDVEVVDALFDAVIKWGKSKNMDKLVGPLGFTDMDPEGMLIEGYDREGTMASIYNHPYYVKHIERMGFEKDADWMEFRIQIPDEMPEKHARISEIISKKYNVKSVRVNSKKELVERYGQEVFKIVNEAYDQLYGFSPLTPRQIDHYLKMYIPIVRLNNLSVVVDKDDNVIAIGLAMPSLSKALIKSRGKLFPLGWYYLLKALKGKNKLVDLLLVGVKPEYQNKGVNALIFTDLIKAFQDNGYKEAETNPELELNQKMQSQWQYFEHEQHKRRRSFKKSI